MKVSKYSLNNNETDFDNLQKKVRQVTERDFRYQGIIRNLVRRYVTVEQRKAEHQGVTEDDVNEIKQDISSFRYELMEILKNSGMNTSISNSITSALASGGKKNRQKERRLMKGFNIVSQPSIGGGSLPPVAELIASFQSSEENISGKLFASTLSEIFTNTPSLVINKKNLQSSNTVSSSQTSICESSGYVSSKNSQNKRTSSYKKKWDSILEAAKTGKMSRLIGRSKSEDSVCDSGGNCVTDTEIITTASNVSNKLKTTQHCENKRKLLRKSTSPISEDNYNCHLTDSNQSIENRKNCDQNYSLGALAALRRKRKKFSASRNQNAVIFPPSIKDRFIFAKRIDKKPLKRAISVPTTNRSDEMRSQRQSSETNNSENLLNSSVDEHGTSSRTTGFCTSSREHLTNTSSSTQYTGSTQTPDEDIKLNCPEPLAQCENIEKLSGIVPINGHQILADWI